MYFKTFLFYANFYYKKQYAVSFFKTVWNRHEHKDIPTLEITRKILSLFESVHEIT